MANASPESLIDAAHSAAVDFINGYCELVDAANDYQGGWHAELMKQIDELNEPSYVCDLMARIAAARHLLPARKVRLGYPKPTSNGMHWGMAGSSWHDAVGRLVGVMHSSLETVFEEWTERIKSKAFDPDELCAAFVEALRIYPPLCGNDVVVDLDIERREALRTIAAKSSSSEATDQAPPATGGNEQGEGASSKKRKPHRRQRGRRRGNYDEALHQKIFATYGTIKDYDALASRYGVSADDARLIVKRHRAREQRKNDRQSRPKRMAK